MRRKCLLPWARSSSNWEMVWTHALSIISCCPDVNVIMQLVHGHCKLYEY
jgi:hypothetical protein